MGSLLCNLTRQGHHRARRLLGLAIPRLDGLRSDAAGCFPQERGACGLWVSQAHCQWHLTIAGAGREAWVVVRHGRWKTVCARGAYRALLGGRSASPLEVTSKKQELSVPKNRECLRLALPSTND